MKKEHLVTLAVFVVGALAGCYILCPLLSKQNILPQAAKVPMSKSQQGESPMNVATKAPGRNGAVE